MACLVAAPSEHGKGVITFTTPERDQVILKSPELQNSIRSMKDRWVIGLHHNWHDHDFTYNDLFDFSMAGEEDLKERHGRPFPLLTMDACNFAPDCFYPGSGERFWDILNIGRAVFFKGIPDFLTAMRALYDRGRMFRALFVCPVPPVDGSKSTTILHDVRDRYNALFSPAERKLFTLMTIDWDYPFPLDLPTLAHLYRSSKVFVHCGADERRSRVAAYAWASGLPVVARDSVGSLLPRSLRHPPCFYEVPAGVGFAERLEEAVLAFDATSGTSCPARHVVAAEHTKTQLQAQLAQLFARMGLPFAPGALALDGLDIRLGRHHGISIGDNRVPQTISDLLAYLASARPTEIAKDLSHPMPELAIAGRKQEAAAAPAALPTARLSGLQRSWNSVDQETAAAYLKTKGYPSQESKTLLLAILRQRFAEHRPRILDLGCGNGQLYEYFLKQGFLCDYTGVDFSLPLLAAARSAHAGDPNARFVEDDVETLEAIGGHFDVAIYSHVLEVIASPERSLHRAKSLAPLVVIRFFEPPDFDLDCTELKEMDLGGGMVPYLRRKMSRRYYQMMLDGLGEHTLVRHRCPADKDQVHVLDFKT